MSKRFILSTIGLAAIAFAPAFLAAQSSKTDAKVPANADTKAASKWVMPRTADGKPGPEVRILDIHHLHSDGAPGQVWQP